MIDKAQDTRADKDVEGITTTKNSVNLRKYIKLWVQTIAKLHLQQSHALREQWEPHKDK